MSGTTELSCRCGETKASLKGKPILSTECLCSDCQRAGSILGSLDGAQAVLDERKATRFVLFRKDRVRCRQGQKNLREHRLQPDSKTRRVVATCCNTPMFLDFTQGHWLSVYGNLWSAETLPPLNLRTMTNDAPEGVELPDDVPNLEAHNLRFFIRLIVAWVAMGFRTPVVDYVQGELHISSTQQDRI
ncbi:DUF6151 family protein [Nitratireductor rhodophyticola]|uniref:GFA family protein n=2 Tax=Nitratireductor rhodophyticola TaxID=2854036 RepID=UPI002AC97A15|nr:DUF6151 family protein [Nitratireductor rhodophyticola]WPZ15161.1 DUF6151 family protein [Nitratireductor rhodophyticola]